MTFYGDIPGPNDDVVVVLQVKSGKGWRTFRGYRIRAAGHFEVGYRFIETTTPTTYVTRTPGAADSGAPV